MRVRRLERSEHEQTRWLYEQVFAEDSQEFADYYYTWKTKDSLIYVAEDGTGFHAMVHLNPFFVSVSGKVQKLHYIVAVATQKEYRHQGLMRRLLEMAEREMAQRGERFTFLMPASEKIYQPFGYRFFAWQRQGILCAGGMPGASDVSGRPKKGLIMSADIQSNAVIAQADVHSGVVADAIERKNVTDTVSKAVCRPVKPQEYSALAAFVNDTLGRQYDVFIFRDDAYYERLCSEQRCQGGEVMVIVQPGQSAEEICAEPGRPDEEICEGSGRSAEKACGEAGRSAEKAYAESGRPDAKMNGSEGRLIGTFCTAREEADSEYEIEIREIIFAEGMRTEALAALRGFVNACANGCGDDGRNNRAKGCAGGSVDRANSRIRCRVAGCQPPIPLEQETFEPLLMGKVPGGGEFAGVWDKERVFINEVV